MKRQLLGDKKILIIFILLFVIAFLYMGLMIFNYMVMKEDIILKKDLTCEFREEVEVIDFIKKINGEVLDNSFIDTNEVGLHKISFSYRNRFGFVVVKNFEIEVLDVTAPTIIVSNPYIVEKGSIDNLVDTIFCADDYYDDVSCKITGESYDLNQVGDYNLTISATDKSGNNAVKEFTVKVVEEIKNDDDNNKKSSFTSFDSVYQKYKNVDTLIGLDLSKWQGEVDFDKIKKQGVEFVMLKIGGQKEINGEFIMDPKFYDNIKLAKEHNLKVGVYFYSYAKSEKEARKQVDWIIDKLDDYDLELPIVFDWENWNKFTTFHISFHTLNKVASAFVLEVEKNGYEAMLYSSKYYLEYIWYRDDYTNWLAYYTKENDYDGEYLMWQVCNDGKIDGIDGYVDIDVLYLS